MINSIQNTHIMVASENSVASFISPLKLNPIHTSRTDSSTTPNCSKHTSSPDVFQNHCHSHTIKTSTVRNLKSVGTIKNHADRIVEENSLNSALENKENILQSEPMYATVRRRRRSPPDGSPSKTDLNGSNNRPQVPLNLLPTTAVHRNQAVYNGEFSLDFSDHLLAHRISALEQKYGGKEIAHWAAMVIQRAFRAKKLQNQFSKLMVLAQSTDRINRRLSLFGPDHFEGDHQLELVESRKAGEHQSRQNFYESHNEHNNSGAKSVSNAQQPRMSEYFDQLLLQAAGLSSNESLPSSTTSSSSSIPPKDGGPSARLIRNRKLHRQQSISPTESRSSMASSASSLRRSASFRETVSASKRRSVSVNEGKQCQCDCAGGSNSSDKMRAKDDMEIVIGRKPSGSPRSSPVPPCPPLRGEEFYPEALSPEPVYITHKSMNLPVQRNQTAAAVPQVKSPPLTICQLTENPMMTVTPVTRRQTPKPPQRTVSFLATDTLPRKMSQLKTDSENENSDNYSDQPIYESRKSHQSDSNLLYVKIDNTPNHSRTVSTPSQMLSDSHDHHNRSVSSPAPLSPPASSAVCPQQQLSSPVVCTPQQLPSPALTLPPPPPTIDIPEIRSDSPLPPPPYISPPIQRGQESPLPPPPPVIPPHVTTSIISETRSACESTSSSSSIDSGFRSSSCSDQVMIESNPTSPTSSVPPHNFRFSHQNQQVSSQGHQYPPSANWISSPNFITSPESEAHIRGSLFEPRPLPEIPNQIDIQKQNYHSRQSSILQQQNHSRQSSIIHQQQQYHTRQMSFSQQEQQQNYSHHQVPVSLIPHQQGPVRVPQIDTSMDTSYCDLYGRISKAPAVQGTPVNYSRSIDMNNPPKVKKSVRIQTPDSGAASGCASPIQTISHPDEINDVVRRRQYRVGLNLFNQNPERGMEYLLKKNFLEYSPASVAKFLLKRKGVSKKVLGDYLTNLQRPFNLAVLHCFVHELDFSGLHLDIAMRQLQDEVTFPGESQKIEKLVEVFSKRYIQCNQMFVAGFNSPDTIFVLSYAMVLLNTDLHTRNVRSHRKMTKDDFVRNLRGVDAGGDLDEDMLKGIYDRIQKIEFRHGADHVTQVGKVEESITGRGKNAARLAEPHRRLVCFCRVTEVPDINKREKTGAHQRGLFLFNDLLIVTKSVARKKTLHQFRYKVVLRDMRVNIFSTAQYTYGIQLQDKITGKVASTFNARSENDQQRFVNDLQESIAEVLEMERARMYLNESETMC